MNYGPMEMDRRSPTEERTIKLRKFYDSVGGIILDYYVTQSEFDSYVIKYGSEIMGSPDVLIK